MLLNGTNIGGLDQNGQEVSLGFFVNVTTSASDPAQAERQAIQRVKNDEGLRQMVGAADLSGMALSLEELQEVDEDPQTEDAVSGYTFYVDEPELN